MKRIYEADNKENTLMVCVLKLTTLQQGSSQEISPADAGVWGIPLTADIGAVG